MTVAAARFADQSGRLADRLRGMSLVRLGRPATGGTVSLALEAFTVAGEILIASSHAQDSPRDGLPWLGDHVVPDQLAVVSHDLLAVSESISEETFDALAQRCQSLRTRT